MGSGFGPSVCVTVLGSFGLRVWGLGRIYKSCMNTGGSYRDDMRGSIRV